MSDTKPTGENPLDRILSDKRKKLDDVQSSPGGLLAKFYRTILYDRKIGVIKFTDHLTNYLELMFPSKDNSNTAASNARGPYNKKFSQKEFTWKVFLEGLRVLGVYKITMSIKLDFVDDTSSTHSINAQLMTNEQKIKFKAKWDDTHGVHKTDNQYLAQLQSANEKLEGEFYDRVKKSKGKWYAPYAKVNKTSSGDN